MNLVENAPIGSKTTMRIGGTARFFAELQTREDVEEAYAFAREKGIPLIPLGGGSNTIFADDPIDALVVRVKAAGMSVDGQRIAVQAGAFLASVLNELGKQGLDLSPLTGIPGSIGGAVFGNAGQGPAGVWIDTFIENVTAFIDGEWKTLSKEECLFRYRESIFKDLTHSKLEARSSKLTPPLIWEVTLHAPTGDPTTIATEIERLLQKRIETQPHVRTAGSCFKAVGQTPAWKLIDAAGLRGLKIGGIQIAEKHANFLLNVEKGTYADAKAIVEKVRSAVTEPLNVEMRFIEPDGSLAY